jgi:hypothetical protein
MESRSEVSPDTLPVDLTPDGIEVTYQDGRRVFYRGVPDRVPTDVTTAPGKDVHVLVTDAGERQGVLVYVDERNTEDEILEATGVGRVLLGKGDETTVFPGVAVRNRQLRIEVAADFGVVDGRVFVFEEDAMGERSFELVPEGEAAVETAGDATATGDSETSPEGGADS